MAGQLKTPLLPGQFDDRNIAWNTLEGIEGMVLSLFSVDPDNNCVDFLVKFVPKSKVLYHRHLAVTHTFVIEGDHVIFEQDGSQRVSRPVGTYYVTEVSDEIHSEGGGPNGCVLLYSVRGDDVDLFELFDDEFNSTGIMGISDFVALSAG